MPFFSNDYQTAKNKFLDAGRAAGARLDQLKIQPLGPNGEALTIDIAVLGDLNASKILLHTSGIHGVEGFAGSAIQIAALSKNILKSPDVCVIFAHILNPFGMAWLRRVNENNIDLNRNFLNAGESYSGSDPSYKQLDKFLNSPYSPHWFWPKLIYNLGRVGFQSLKNAIVQGQYEFSDGLFFGGQSLQEGPKLYKAWLKKNIRPPKVLLALDVHTGLGRFGEEVLFCHTNYTTPDIGKKVTALSEPVGYKVRGGLESLTNEVFSESKWVHFTEEFGTYSMAKILKTLREENVYFKSQKSIGDPGHRLLNFMNPEDQSWRSNAVERGLETLARSCEWLAGQNV